MVVCASFHFLLFFDADQDCSASTTKGEMDANLFSPTGSWFYLCGTSRCFSEVQTQGKYLAEYLSCDSGYGQVPVDYLLKVKAT